MHIDKQYTRPIGWALFRVIFYGAVMFGISQLIYLDSVTITDTGKFGENSFTEWTQEVMLLLSSVLFFALGRYDRTITGFSGLLSGMMFMALIREFNNYFHTWFSGAWQVFVLIALIITVIYVYRNRNTFIKPFYDYFYLPAFGVSLAGFVTLLVYSRLFGRGSMWRNILEVEELEGTYRWVKNAAEEGTELLGYTLLFLAALEYCWYIIDKKGREKKTLKTHL
jgi:hypothetical protein